MAATELKPCPFCRSTEFEVRRSIGGSFWVLCVECKAAGPTAFKESQAEHLWNSRD